MKILQVAQHELRRIFVSPLAWATLGVVQFIIAVVFLLTLHDLANNPRFLMDETVGVTEIIGGSIYGFAALLFLLVVPLLTMRMFSEERRSGSIDLYLSAPISLTELVLGKYLGLLGFLLAMLLVLAIMPLSLLPATPLDFGRLCAGLLGLYLMMASFGAAGLFVSSLTEQPVIAAVVSLVLLLLLWLVGWFSEWTLPLFGQELALGAPLGYLSMTNHFDSFIQGIFDSSDVIYYLLFCGVFLALTVQRLDMERN